MTTFKIVSTTTGKTHKTNVEGLLNALEIAEQLFFETHQPINLIDEQKDVLVFTVDKG